MLPQNKSAVTFLLEWSKVVYSVLERPIWAETQNSLTRWLTHNLTNLDEINYS